MKGMRNRAPVRIVTAQEREDARQETERQYPGYLEESRKLTTMVKIFTGLRILYGLYYLAITLIYGMQLAQGIFTIGSAFVFYLWYSWMLRSGKGVAVLMLVLRGVSIVTGGVSLLGMAHWLPFPLVFTLTAACAMEFCEAVFCIYVLFNQMANTTIRLNRELERKLVQGVSAKTLERMAEYQNPYSGDGDSAGEKNGTEENDGRAASNDDGADRE